MIAVPVAAIIGVLIRHAIMNYKKAACIWKIEIDAICKINKLPQQKSARGFVFTVSQSAISTNRSNIERIVVFLSFHLPYFPYLFYLS